MIRHQQLHLFMSQLAILFCVTSTSKPNKACCWNPRVLDPELNLSATRFKWIAEVLKVVPSCEIKFSCLWCKRFAMFLDPNWCLFNPWQHHRLLSAAASRWADEILNRESLYKRIEAAALAATSTNPTVYPALPDTSLSTHNTSEGGALSISESRTCKLILCPILLSAFWKLDLL